MKLVSLKLLNYRRFRQEEIFFKDDFTLIFWRNWAWKSSILDAIWYALFGPSSKDFVRVNTWLLKSHFITDRQPSKIELNFMLWLDNYRIVRVIDAWVKKLSIDFIQESKDSMFWPNNLEIIGWSEVSNYLIKLLWVDRDTFLRSVFAKQKDLEVLSGTMQERKNLINSILWLDKIEFIIMDLKKQAKDKKTVLDYLKTTLENFDFEELNSKKEIINQEILKISKNLDENTTKKQILDKDFEIIKKDFDEITTKKNIFSKLNSESILKQNQIQNLQKNIEEKQKNIEEINKKEIYLEENKNILNDFALIWDKINILNLNRQKFSQKNTLLSEQKKYFLDKDLLEKSLLEFRDIDFKNISKTLENEILDLEKKQSENQVIVSKLQADIDLIVKSWKELKEELNNINLLWSEADCPTCKRPLNTHFPKLVELFQKDLDLKLAEHKAKTIEVWEKNKIIQNLKDSLQIQKQKLLELNSKEKEYLIILEKQKSLLQNLENIELKLKDYVDISFDEEEFIISQNLFKELETKAKNYNIILWEVSWKKAILDYIENSKNQIIQIQNDITKLNQELLVLVYKEEDFVNLKANYDKINSEIFTLNTLLNQIQSQKLNQEFELKSILKKENDIKDSKKQIDELIVEIDYINLKKEILSDYILYLLDYLKPNIEDLASQYFSIITDNKYSLITLDSEYNILIDEKNIDLYSGWERDLANLCLRLSLWQNISSSNSYWVNFLVLDEVLASQDKDRQQNILVNLKKLEQKFSQILLISHLEDIKEMASNIIEVKQKNIEESLVLYW